MLEYAVRDDLNDNAPRAMCVLNPLKVTLTNVPLDMNETMIQAIHPNRPELGEREMRFTQSLYIDKADFTEEQGLSRKKFKRLVLGEWVRLRGGYIIKADESVKNEAGEVIEILASIVPGTVGENPPEGIRPRGVIHWVSATDSFDCEVRLYDRLFNDETPDAGDKNYIDFLNPESLTVLSGCKAERSLATALPGVSYQFEREGYFCLDSKHSTDAHPVFNRAIGLKDNWKK